MLYHSASESVALLCVLPSTGDSVSVSLSVYRLLIFFLGAKHVIISQSASQLVAR